MTKSLGLSMAVALSAVVSLAVSDAGAARKGSEISTQGRSVEAREQAMADLHARLSAATHAAQRHVVELSPSEREILSHPGLDATGRFRVGVHRSLDRPAADGKTDLVVRVPGARALRLELVQVEGTVAVFNAAGEAHEYETDGFTHVFAGDEVTVRGSARVKGAGAVNFGGNLCDFNAACTENAQCVALPPAIDGTRGAIAMILFFSRGFYYLCSGGLVADSDPASEIPYFLTANHCVSKGREASSVLTYFDHVESSCAGGSCAFPSAADTSGASIATTASTSDYTLLVLGQTPPAGRVFLGWDTTPVAFTDGAALYRISHPGGAPQAYSAHSVDTAAGICGIWPRGRWIYSRDTFGATEGGSSGSPVLNAAGEIVGQLSGACGFNVTDQCDAINNATVDGAFSSYYPQLQQFLGDGVAGCSSAGDCADGDACTADTCSGGVCSHTAVSCNDGNACTADSCDPATGACTNDAIVPCCGDGVCQTSESQCGCAADCGAPPSVEVHCADGIDNDCDGMTDCADADCGGDPGCAGATCGDRICAGGSENCFTCPGDCRCQGRNCGGACCGDGSCAGSENRQNCATDCG